MNGRESKHRRVKPRTRATASDYLQQRILPTSRRLKTILEATTEGYGHWNVSSGEVSFGDSWMTSLGYSARNLPKDKGFLRSIIHPDDLGAFDAQLKAVLDGASAMLDCECRFRTKAGPYKWFQIRGRVVRRNKQGRAMQMVGMVIDITARKHQQEQLSHAH